MKKVFLIVGLTVMMLLESVVFAQEALTPALEAQIGEPVKEVTKETKLTPKSFVRKIGDSRVYAPGQKKANALEATAKAFAPGQVKKAADAVSAKEFAPGQVKKAAGVVSARGFARKHAETAARKKQLFKEIAVKQKPQKPLKGQPTTFRGAIYKPTKL